MPDSPDVDSMITDATVISAMATRIAAKAEEMAQEWARIGRPSNDGTDPLGPVREAMRRYEAALAARQHGGMAAAQFVDAVYAILNPNAADPVEHAHLQFVASPEPDEQEAEFSLTGADAEWCG